ncbi:MAG: hypothetical protein FJ278_17175, partial [Planctomycetes bacterium]|nr:hypothetical protein [Planctomycetota bacterium]
MRTAPLGFALLFLATVALAQQTPSTDRGPQRDQIVKRNIFNPSFGPTAPSEAATTTIVKPSPETLTGILRLDGEYVAVVENKETRSSQLVRVGAQVKEGTVVAIDLAKIEIEKDGQRRAVALGEAIGTVSVTGPAPSSASTPSPTTSSTPLSRPSSAPTSAAPPIPSDKLQALM